MDSTAQSVKAEDSNQQVVGTLKKKGTFSETNAATEHEVTLDYAFREISAVEELLKEVPKGFEKKEDGDGKEKKAEQDDIGYPTLSTKKKKDEDETTEVVKYNSKSVRINNNSLTTVATLPFVLNSILFKPDLVGWIDLSFNQLTTIEEAVLSMKNLSVLYLHANNMKKLNEVDKLKKLPKLRTVTLHGNPLEEVKGYRVYVLQALPNLRSLDFGSITVLDRDKAKTWENIYGKKKR